MIVQRLSTSEQLLTLADEWNCLARCIPFCSWEWLYSWWRQYRADRELFVLTVRDGSGQLIGLAPWQLERSPAWGRVVRFLGSGDVCSDYLSILSTPEHEAAVVTAVADWMIEASSGRGHGRNDEDGWDLLELTGVEATDRTAAELLQRFSNAGLPVHRRPGMSFWRIELPRSWDGYLALLSKQRRKQVRRLQRRWLDSGRAAPHFANTPEELSQGMEVLTELHQRRWRKLGQAGCFASPAFAAFVREAAERLWRADRLRLHWIELEGRPAAAEFQVVGGGVTYPYQSGVEPDLLPHHPGNLSMILAVRNAIDEGQHSFDLLRGDEPYKAHWRAQPRPSVELRVAARRPVAQLRHGVWWAGGAVKGWVKNTLSWSNSERAATT